MDALFTGMQIPDWLLISNIPSMNCLLILQLEATISCCLFLLIQSPNRRPRPPSHRPRASRQLWMHCTLKQPQLSTGGSAIPFLSFPPWQGHLSGGTRTKWCARAEIPTLVQRELPPAQHKAHGAHKGTPLIHLKKNRRWRISRVQRKPHFIHLFTSVSWT